MKKPDVIPYSSTEKRRILRAAREAGVLSYNRLDRFLLDACESPARLQGLLRSLKDVRIVESTDPGDMLNEPFELVVHPEDVKGRDLYGLYAERIRSMRRLSRAEEHVLARRIEFVRERLRQLLRSTRLPEKLRERTAERGLNREALRADLLQEHVDVSPGRVDEILATVPDGSRDPVTVNTLQEYDRLRSFFVERNLYLVIGMSAAYRTYGIPVMDLIQEGNASLIRAVEKFDWRKNVRFQTYATWWVRQAIERLITANRGIVRVPNYIQQKMRRLRREGKLPRNQRDMDIRDVSTHFDTTPEGAARLMETDRHWFSLDAPLGEEEDSFVARLEAEAADETMSASERRMLGERLGEVMSRHLTASTWDGSWVLTGGRISIADESALGTTNGGVVLNFDNAGIEGTTFDLNGVHVAAESLLMTSDAANLRTRLRTAVNSGSNSWAGPITVTGNGSVQFTVNAGSELDLAGTISGTNDSTLMIRGSTTATGVLSGVMNTPNARLFQTDGVTWRIESSGHDWDDLVIALGTMELAVDQALDPSGRLGLGQAGGVGILDLGSFTHTVAGLFTSGGTPANQVIGNGSTTGPGILIIEGSNTPSAFGGTIQDAIGAGNQTVTLVVKDGHELTLTGDPTYSGNTEVSNATLFVTRTLLNTPIFIHANSLYGGGGIASNLTIAAMGEHNPGFNGAGLDILLGNVFQDGKLTIDIQGLGGNLFDQVYIDGFLALGANSILEVNEFTNAMKQVYVIAEYAARVGKFAVTNNLPPGYVVIYDYGLASNQIALVNAASTIWDGEAPDNSWPSNPNWVFDIAPPAVTTNTIWFDLLGASLIGPGVISSSLDQDRTMGGLFLNTQTGFYQTIDTTGFAINVIGDVTVSDIGRNTHVTIADRLGGGSLSVTNGNFYIGLNGGTDQIDIDTAFTFDGGTNHLLDIARRFGTQPSNTMSTINLSNAPNVAITADQILIASASAHNGGEVLGNLFLADTGTNRVTATTIVAGDSPTRGNTGIGTSTIRFGGDSVLAADVVTLGLRKSRVRAETSAGSLTLRGRTKPEMTLRLGFNDAGTGTASDGHFDASGAILDAHFDTLELGQHTSGNGEGNGHFTMDRGTGVANRIILAIDTGAQPLDTDGNLNVAGGYFDVLDSVTNGLGDGSIRVINGLMTVSNQLYSRNLLVGGNGNSSGTMLVGKEAHVGFGLGGNLDVARNTIDGTTSFGLLNLLTSTNLTVDANVLRIGTGSYQAYGTMLLPTRAGATNSIRVNTLTMGDVNPNGNQAQFQRFEAGALTTIRAANLYVGRKKSRAEMVLSTNGATLLIGGISNRVTNLRIGFNDINTGTRGIGILSASNGTVRAWAGATVLGRHDGTDNIGGYGVGKLFLNDPTDLLDTLTMILAHTDGDEDASATGELHIAHGTLRAGTVTLANAKDLGVATAYIGFTNGWMEIGTLQSGNTSGTQSILFDWTGGSLVVSNVNIGIPLVQGGGFLVPGHTNRIGSTVVSGQVAVVDGEWTIDLDGAGGGTSDVVAVSGDLDLSGARLNLVVGTNALDDAAYVIAEYGNLVNPFGAVTNLPSGYKMSYNHGRAGIRSRS